MNASIEAEQATEKPNRMERRRLETRAKLMAATLKLLIKKGVDKMTLDDITETADLGRRTFYYHFSSKEACIVATVADAYKKHAEDVDAVHGVEDPALVVAISIQVILNALLEEPVTACLVDQPRLLGLILVEALGDFVRRDMERGFAAGQFEAAISAPILDRMLMWTIVGLLVESQDINEERAVLLHDYAQTFLMILGLPIKKAKSVASKAMKRIAA
jgi:AcrR family transcriptional regulator